MTKLQRKTWIGKCENLKKYVTRNNDVKFDQITSCEISSWDAIQNKTNTENKDNTVTDTDRKMPLKWMKYKKVQNLEFGTSYEK